MSLHEVLDRRRSAARWTVKAVILLGLLAYCGCATSTRSPAENAVSDDDDSADEQPQPSPQPPSRGTVPFRKVDTAISAHWDEVRDCYLKIVGPGKPSQEGTIDTEITIGSQGKALDVRIVNSTLKSPEVESCIVDLIRRIDDFPKPDGGVEAVASYSFYFSEPKQ